MPKRNTELSIEQIREQNRQRAKRFYSNHREEVKKAVRDRYHEKKQQEEQNNEYD